MRLTSFGAADGVTGSNHLVEVGGLRILLDCGLFQGLKLHRERNWQALPIARRECDHADGGP
jgi:metallo-beta-lactamase family protein